MVSFRGIHRIDQAGHRAGEVDSHRRNQCPESGENAGVDREYHFIRLEKFSHAAGMNRTRTAESDDRDSSKVHAHLDAVHRCCCGHVLVDDVMDSGRSVDHAERQFIGRGSGGRIGQRCVERHVAAEEGVGVEQAEDHVGVGHRRDCPALGIARGPGISPGRLGSDLQQAELIHPSQTAASGADLDEVHGRN